MRLALVQFNPVIGDITGNARRASDWIARARDQRADLIVFPELALCGYPPRDLLLQQGFDEAIRAAAIQLASTTAGGPVVMIGAPWRPPPGLAADGWDPLARLTNSILVMRGGRIAVRYDKRLLPTYDVFDEDRYFRPGDAPLVVNVLGVKVGVSICEDLWRGADALVHERYRGGADPVTDLIRGGASIIINPSASPFVLGKGPRQRAILTRHVAAHGVAVAAVNQVGGNDDLIFDGHAAVYAPSLGGGASRLVAAGPGFQEALVMCDVPAEPRAWGPAEVRDPLLDAPREALLWNALVIGVRDYCRKTGFRSCILGLSGGIDSALTACIAAAALGPENVHGFALPSRFSSQGSLDDARELARRLGTRFTEVPIEALHTASESTLAPVFDAVAPGAAPGITEENVQSRIRGLILMALSNKTAAILLTTGNKSELAVGYCTLYGDMNGGLAVLSDVTKMDVYRLSRWINHNHTAAGFTAPPIPEPSITKPPSAELRPNQTDQDSLPPYEQLDEVIERYIEKRQGGETIVRETGFDQALVARIIRLIDFSEYKRRQMPTGLKVTSNAFGPGRRWPIAQGYRQ